MSADRTKFLTTARARWKQATDADQKQRERELADLRFYAGEQWDPDILRSRQGQNIGSGTNQQIVPARPSLVINKTREPVRQVLNQERQSDLGVELIPADDWGEMSGPIDHTEIELREGLVRRIQRDSEAADARTWAFSRSAIAGRGYWGVMTRYVPKSADQEVYIYRFWNQSAVVVDPSHQQPDASDIDWGFVGADVPLDKYKVEHPTRNGRKNRVAEANDDEWRALGDEAPGWFTTTGDGDTAVRSVRVVDYWHTVRTSTELTHLSDGRAIPTKDLDKLPPGVTVLLDDKGKPITHTDIEKQIKWAKIDGCNDDVLEETDWPGHYIPIIKVIGEELQPYDQERRCEGIVRPMRDACQGNNYIISKFVERVGLTPIPPIVMAGGQDDTYEAEWDAMTTRTIGRLHYNQKDEFNNPAPPPFRPDARAEIADIGMGVQIFGQAIASTSVVPETALGNVDPSVKSGKLAKALIEQANRGTSNFLDNLMRSMRHEARIVNDLLYPIYGTRPGRLARMMNPEGEMSAVVIGQPFTMQGQGKMARPMPLPQGQQPQPGQPIPEGVKQYKLTPDAEFNVAIKISKNYDTRREQEAEILGQVIEASPEQLAIIGDLFFKYQDGPGHEEMSERYKAVLAPPVQALVSGKPNVPPEIQQQMAQMQEAMQKLQQDADKNLTTLKKTQMDNESKERTTQMELQAKERLALVQQLGALAAVDAKVDAENARTELDAVLARANKELDIRLQHLDQMHQSFSQGKDHAHEAALEHLKHSHAMEQGAQAAAAARDQAITNAALQPSDNGAGA